VGATPEKEAGNVNDRHGCAPQGVRVCCTVQSRGQPNIPEVI
jgi:hypothetical protein